MRLRCSREFEIATWLSTPPFSSSPHELNPDSADNFDRTANVFATEELFQLDNFNCEASDRPFGIKPHSNTVPTVTEV